MLNAMSPVLKPNFELSPYNLHNIDVENFLKTVDYNFIENYVVASCDSYLKKTRCRRTDGIPTRKGDMRPNHESQNTDAQAPTTTLHRK